MAMQVQQCTITYWLISEETKKKKRKERYKSLTKKRDSKYEHKIAK